MITITSIALIALVIGLSSVTPVMAPSNGSQFPIQECSSNDFICKIVSIQDEAILNGQVEVNELVTFRNIITIFNSSQDPWINPSIKDRWGAELLVGSCDVLLQPGDIFIGTAITTTKGKSDKEFLDIQVSGTLFPGQSLDIVCIAQTDTNPGGQQEYSSPGEYEFNSGAVVKFKLADGSQQSFETGGISVEVECSENEEVDSKTGDCVCIPGFEENPNGICISATG